MKKEKPIKEQLRTGRFPTLAPDQVYEIRRRAKAGEPFGILADEFGVTPQTLSKAVYGQGAYSKI